MDMNQLVEAVRASWPSISSFRSPGDYQGGHIES